MASGDFSLPEGLQDDILKCTVCSHELKDPVLLKCLHSLCRSCVSDTALVMCPSCRVATDIAAQSSNLLVSSLIQRSLQEQKAFSCFCCMDDGLPDAMAVARCYNCQLSLCVDCEKNHRRLHVAHKIISIDGNTILSELLCPVVRSCAQHGEEMKLACFTCKMGCCYKCAHDCYTSSHDVQPIDSSTAKERTTESGVLVTQVLSDLNTALSQLQAYLNLPAEIKNARDDSITKLKGAKKTVMDSISDSYECTEVSIGECWEALELQSLVTQESAKRLKARAQWTSYYCNTALSTGDIVGLLPQLDMLLASTRSLLEEAREYKGPVDVMKMVKVNTFLPPNLKAITSSWFGLAKKAAENSNGLFNELAADESDDYSAQRVLTIHELEELLMSQKEQQRQHLRDREAVDELKSLLLSKDEQLDSAKKKLASVRAQQKSQLKDLEVERTAAAARQMELTSTKTELASTQKELMCLREQLQNQLKDLELEPATAMPSQTELAATKAELALPKPLRFDEKPHLAFSGMGRCWDVAVMPHGGLLVAALRDGLKEYEASTYRNIATWKPAAELIGDKIYSEVCTVDSLTDGRAVVGMHPKQIVLLQRNTAARHGADGWKVVQRFTADLQAPPRDLSVWCDRLLAVLENRWDESSQLWRCGPGLLLLSLSDGKQLHRQKLDYNADSVALTELVVTVCSANEVELTDSSREASKSKSCVVDCYSHAGLRLWRHVVESGLKVLSLCSDSAGRVLYAAKRGSVVALSVGDGRELNTALRLSTKETDKTYAIAIDTASCRLLALISEGSRDVPNTITVFHRLGSKLTT